MIRHIFLVALDGALGSIVRFLIAKVAQGTSLSPLPFGTLTANLLGCLFIGFVYAVAESGRIGIGNGLKLFLIAGLCGGLTTFSSYLNESFQLFRSTHIMTAGLYIGGSIILGLLAIYGGMVIGKLVS